MVRYSPSRVDTMRRSQCARNRRIASSSSLTLPLQEGATRSFSVWLITACFLFTNLCSVSLSAQELQGLAVAQPAAYVNSNGNPAEGSKGVLSRSGDVSLPEAPLPQIARTVLPGKLFAFGPSAGTTMPDMPPDPGSGQNGGSSSSNKDAIWAIISGAGMALGGGLMIQHAKDSSSCQPPNTPCSTTPGAVVLACGAAMMLIGALMWHHHPAQHPEAAPINAPPVQQPQGNTVAPAQAIGRNPNGATTTTIRNNTPYTLQVQIGVCPSCLSLNVPAGQYQTVNLNPGQYYETVQALGSNAPPYQGWQTYGAGTAYEETYLITTQ